MRLVACKVLLTIIRLSAIALGRLLPRDIDPETGVDRRTGSRLEVER